MVVIRRRYSRGFRNGSGVFLDLGGSGMDV